MNNSPASEAQVSFIRSLVERRLLSSRLEESFKAINLDTISMPEASLLITTLKAQPFKPVAAYPAPADRSELDKALSVIPKSKYALLFEDLGNGLTDVPAYRNDTLFVEVREYKGKIYMRRLHGAVGGFTRSRINTRDTIAIANTIAKNPLEAAQRFGRLYSCCAVCAADLTDETSRALSLGPVCRTRFGL